MIPTPPRCGTKAAATSTAPACIESITRHILTWIDTWENEGFRPVHEMWCGRVEEPAGDAAPGKDFLGLDDDGNLLVAASGGAYARRLIDRIERF